MSFCIEVPVDVPPEYGLECSYYENINYNTQHLREQLYIEVVVDDKFVFRPSIPPEHTPVVSFRTYAINTTHAYGKGRPLRALFCCHTPSRETAEKAEAIVKASLLEITQGLGRPELDRSISSFFAAVRYKRKLEKNFGGPAYRRPAYRPPKEVRSKLEPPPAPVEDGSFASFQEAREEAKRQREENRERVFGPLRIANERNAGLMQAMHEAKGLGDYLRRVGQVEAKYQEEKKRLAELGR